MKTETPFFTILVPTNGRVALTRFALESLRVQTFSDFEVIILDSDQTSDTANAYFDGWQNWLDNRFRYVRSGNVWMSQNFETGLAHARGQYLHVCQDKAVMAGDALEMAHQAISKDNCQSLVFEIVSHAWAAGNHEILNDRPGLTDMQRQPRFAYGSGMKVVSDFVQSPRVLDKFLKSGWETICFETPRAFNCFTDLKLIRQIKERGIAFFDSMSPDLCSALRLLDVIEGFHRTPAHLASHLHGGDVSAGTTTRYKFGAAVNFFAMFEPELSRHMHRMPLGLMPLFHNAVFADYVNVRDTSVGNVRASKLQAEDYFAKVMEDIKSLHESEERKSRLAAIVTRTKQAYKQKFI